MSVKETIMRQRTKKKKDSQKHMAEKNTLISQPQNGFLDFH